MKFKCGLQTIVFGDDFQNRIKEDLLFTKKSGFDVIETASYIVEDYDPNKLIEILFETGVELFAVHGGLSEYSTESRLIELLERLQKLKCSNLILSGVLPGSSLESYQNTGELLFKLGMMCQEKGVRLHYHHYEFEYKYEWNEKSALLHLFETANKKNFTLNIVVDTYWAAVAEVGLSWIWKHFGDCCNIVHIKDGDPSVRTFCPLGDGEAKLEQVWSFLMKNGSNLDCIIYEQDFASSDSIENSVQFSGNWMNNRKKAVGNE